MTATVDVAPAARPLREGLLQFDPPRLLGSRCHVCGTTIFPAREFCPKCRVEGSQSSLPLSPQGSVFSYTVVHQAPGGRPTPYVLAYVDLKDDVRVLAQLEHPADAVSIGMPVSLRLKQVAEDGGMPIIGYVFAADPDAGGAE